MNLLNITAISISIVGILYLQGCGSNIEATVKNTQIIDNNETIEQSISGKKSVKISKFIREDRTLTADTNWLLDGLVVVKKGVTLTVEEGTTVAGMDGIGRETSYLIVENGAKIMAIGTKEKPIIFTSYKALRGEEAAPGQWGGLTILGDAGNPQVDSYEAHNAFYAGRSNLKDNSGVLKYVKILNSGIEMEKDKEINGLSLLGVGSETIIDNITIDMSGDDGIEIWGGTVNLTNVSITRCNDDYFDIDDGFSGSVKNLNITTTSGTAAIEMSGNTSATFDGFSIVQNGSLKEGGIFFKKDGIGGVFMNGTVTDNVEDEYGAIHALSSDEVSDRIDKVNTSFRNVILNGSSKGPKITGTSVKTLSEMIRDS